MGQGSRAKRLGLPLEGPRQENPKYGSLNYYCVVSSKSSERSTLRGLDLRGHQNRTDPLRTGLSWALREFFWAGLCTWGQGSIQDISRVHEAWVHCSTYSKS